MSTANRRQVQEHPDSDDRFVKAGVIAKIYDVDPSTIHKWAKRKKIPCVEFEGIQRFHIATVRKHIEGGKSGH
jgi:uncharacterized protein YjcR